MLISSLVCPGGEHHRTSISVRLTAAQIVLLLMLVGVTCAYSTTVGPEHLDLHSVDDRGNWYVDRGVRPIGRFGKRQSGDPSLVKNLDFLLRIMWHRKVRSPQRVQASDWLS